MDKGLSEEEIFNILHYETEFPDLSDLDVSDDEIEDVNENISGLDLLETVTINSDNANRTDTATVGDRPTIEYSKY
jgi:Leucine-rich repeat (LRR) protein